MLLADTLGYDDLIVSVDEPFPADVEFVLSALEAGPRPLTDRHRFARARYHARAMLKLFSDGDGASPKLLFTRSVSSQAIGFVTRHPLPLSHGGIVLIPKPRGEMAKVSCTVLRCRLAAPNWYEGAVYFNRPQDCFAAEQLETVEA